MDQMLTPVKTVTSEKYKVKEVDSRRKHAGKKSQRGSRLVSIWIYNWIQDGLKIDLRNFGNEANVLNQFIVVFAQV